LQDKALCHLSTLKCQRCTATNGTIKEKDK
jgi:hypothetical protein